MMTQPIQTFESLTSETSPAGGNVSNRDLELRARYARAHAVVWLFRLFKGVAEAIKARYRLGLAEAQLHRMNDRELADLGLCRADIAFAVRRPVMTGIAPQFDTAVIDRPAAANQNVRRAA